MKKYLITVLFMFSGVFLIVSSAVTAEEAHVSIVTGRSLAPYEEAIRGIKESLSRSGLSLEVDVHNFEGKLDDKQKIVDELRKDGAKMVITVGSEAAKALKDELPE